MSGPSAYAATTANFDGGADTPSTLQTFRAPTEPEGGPTILTEGGNPGGFLRLTADVNGQNNYASFDRSDAGTFALSTFSFQFRIGGVGPSADGFSFSFADTSMHGVSGGLAGPIYGGPEDPAAAGSLGFGFDTWSNQGAFDNPNVPTGSDYQEISLFYNGGLVQRIDDTRLLTTPLTLDDGNWHTASGNINFEAGTASLSVDGTAVFSDVAVAGLTPFESRIIIAGRTGGENSDQDIDNIDVQFVPEPSTALLGLLGLGGLLFWRSKKR